MAKLSTLTNGNKTQKLRILWARWDDGAFKQTGAFAPFLYYGARNLSPLADLWRDLFPTQKLKWSLCLHHVNSCPSCNRRYSLPVSLCWDKSAGGPGTLCLTPYWKNKWYGGMVQFSFLQCFFFQFVQGRSQSVFILCIIEAGIALCVLIAEHLWVSCRILRVICCRAGMIGSGFVSNHVVIQTRKSKSAPLSFPSLVCHQVQEKWGVTGLMGWPGLKWP